MDNRESNRESNRRSQHENIQFVLCEPRIAQNVSASNDFVRTLGFSSPRLVSNTRAGRIDAGIDLLRYPTIREATANQILTVGLTRRVGQKRKSSSLSLETFCEYLSRWWHPDKISSWQEGPGVALVFGNESSGLSDDEIESCNLTVSIPTSPACPSLNLSHAVAIVAYRVAMALDDTHATGDEFDYDELAEPALSKQTLEGAVNDLLETIARGGYLLQDGPQGLKIFIRDLLSRCAPTESEATYLSGLIAEIVEG